MKITMTNTRDGSPDGVTVNRYTAGQAYNVPARLGDLFVASGDATTDVAAPAVVATPPAASAEGAPAVVVGKPTEGLGTQGKPTIKPPANKKGTAK